MKPTRDLVADRPLAQHSPLLLGQLAAPEELDERLAALGQNFARQMAPRLAPMLGGNIPKLTCSAPQITNGEQLAKQFSGLSANSLLALGAGEMVAHFSGAIAIALTDRVFGGSGSLPETLPEEFPASANLAIGQLEKLICTTLALAHGGDAPTPANIANSAANFAKLRTLPGICECYSMAITVEEETREPWQIVLATRTSKLAQLLADSRPALKKQTPARPHSPLARPMADIPLWITAQLARRNFPASRIATLRPGDLLPLPMAGEIPLLLGTTQIARGTIGSIDDRIAIKITANHMNLPTGDQ